MSTCNDCKYSIIEDYGYSNYTVEGSDIDCLNGLNPGFPVDNWYGDSKETKFGATCPAFFAGTGVAVDVDRDEGELVNYSDDPEIKVLLEARS